jgi:hypothetical protein
MIRCFKICFLILIGSSPIWLVAQTTATLSVDTNAILIGDQIGLELSFEAPSDYKIYWPNTGDTIISEIEVLEKSSIDTVYNDDRTSMLLTQRMKITSFDSGYYAIPPFRFNWKRPGDTVQYFTETEATLLEVKTVPVNLDEEIKDIKEPLRAPYTLREALPWIIGVILAAALTFLVFYYLKKRKKDEPIFRVAPKPKLPPHRIALDALEELRYKKLWQSGRIKEYHTELTEIVREYISSRFNIHALESTSDEILEAISQTSVNGQAREKLKATLILADLVKFAKEQPLPLEHDTSLNNVIDFVKETMYTTPENGSADQLDDKERQEDVTVQSDHMEKPAVEKTKDGLDEKGKEGKDV